MPGTSNRITSRSGGSWSTNGSSTSSRAPRPFMSRSGVRASPGPDAGRTATRSRRPRTVTSVTWCSTVGTRPGNGSVTSAPCSAGGAIIVSRATSEQALTSEARLIRGSPATRPGSRPHAHESEARLIHRHRHRRRDPDPARAVIDSARVTLIAAPRARGSASDEHAGSGVSQAHQPSSSTERPLRAWQRSALARYLAAAPRDFLAVATPGAGKTAFALRVASELLADRVIDAITVVAPTEHLKTQWSLAAASVGIAIDPRLPQLHRRHVGRLPRHRRHLRRDRRPPVAAPGAHGGQAHAGRVGRGAPRGRRAVLG